MGFVELDDVSGCCLEAIDHCRIHLDRRLTWGETAESATAELEAIAGDQTTITIPVYDRPSYKGTVYAQDKVYPTWKLSQDHPLVQAGARAYAQLCGEAPRIDKWTFSTNAVAICGHHSIPCIGFGPGDEVYAHAPNEAIPIDHLESASAFYTHLAYILGEEE